MVSANKIDTVFPVEYLNINCNRVFISYPILVSDIGFILIVSLSTLDEQGIPQILSLALSNSQYCKTIDIRYNET